MEVLELSTYKYSYVFSLVVSFELRRNHTIDEISTPPNVQRSNLTFRYAPFNIFFSFQELFVGKCFTISELILVLIN